MATGLPCVLESQHPGGDCSLNRADGIGSARAMLVPLTAG